VRAVIEGLGVKNPLGFALPAAYHEDDFVQRFCEGLDEVLAPVPSTIDNFAAYLDPDLAPDDFLEWLAGWAGLELDQTWPIERRRALVANAVQLYRGRGTAACLAAFVELYVGVRPEIVEGGATGWSPTPGGEMPGQASNEVVVRLQVPDPARVDLVRLDRLIAANKPAHVAHRVELTEAPRSAPSQPPPPPPPPPGVGSPPPPPPGSRD
jgi:phage tail-like protein